MPTTTAAISITNDIPSSTVSVSQTMTLYKAGSATLGMDTMLSVSKILTHAEQEDLFLNTVAGSTTHNFLYLNNPSSNPAEYFRIGLGAASTSTTPQETEEIGRLYGGQWMFIPYSAADANSDVMIMPSVATEMTVEYMIFS